MASIQVSYTGERFLDLFWLCPRASGTITWTPEAVIFIFVMILTGVIAGYGLTAFIQATVPLHIRREMLKLCHCCGGILWAMPFLSCNAAMYLPMCLNTFLWGSEPFDNVLSARFWQIINHARRQGDGMPLYWAVSSVLVHVWFVSGAAVIAVGQGRPSWFFFAIPCFQASHIARLLSYSHLDKHASILEATGVLGLFGCVVVAGLWYDGWLSTVWLAVSVAERCTHLPSAFRLDASWMRSYELWEEAEHQLAAFEASQAAAAQQYAGSVLIEAGLATNPMVAESPVVASTLTKTDSKASASSDAIVVDVTAAA